MKRLAVLIQAPLSGSDYLDGVKTDINCWIKHLTSLAGGAWIQSNDDNNEILLLKNPSKVTIKSALSLAKSCDFSLVAFSGHGFVKNDGMLDIPTTFMYINEDENISEWELNPGSPRCILSLDCCRNYMRSDALDESLANETYSFAETNRDFFRQKYESQILQCEKGCTRLYAASLDQSASDRPSFTQILTRSAALFNDLYPTLSLDIKDAMLRTSTELRETFKLNQTPVYNGGRRLKHFPFVVGG